MKRAERTALDHARSPFAPATRLVPQPFPLETLSISPCLARLQHPWVSQGCWGACNARFVAFLRPKMDFFHRNEPRGAHKPPHNHPNREGIPPVDHAWSIGGHLAWLGGLRGPQTTFRHHFRAKKGILPPKWAHRQPKPGPPPASKAANLLRGPNWTSNCHLPWVPSAQRTRIGPPRGYFGPFLPPKRPKRAYGTPKWTLPSRLTTANLNHISNLVHQVARVPCGRPILVYQHHYTGNMGHFSTKMGRPGDQYWPTTMAHHQYWSPGPILAHHHGPPPVPIPCRPNLVYHVVWVPWLGLW